MQSVKDVKKILAWWTFTDREFIRKVLRELRIFAELRPKTFYGEFVVVGYRYLLNLRFLHKMLLASKDILKEVFIDDVLVRQVVLDYGDISKEKLKYLRCLSR